MAGTVETDLIEAPGGKPVAMTKQWAARAHANIAGATTPASLRASKGISSLTDVNLGRYLLNFASPFSDALYSQSHAIGRDSSNLDAMITVSPDVLPTALATELATGYVSQAGTNSRADIPRMYAIFFGDLAP